MLPASSSLRPAPGFVHPATVNLTFRPGARWARAALFAAMIGSAAQTYAPTAWAQQGAKLDGARLDQARKLMEEGQALFAKQDFTNAATKFHDAYVLQPFAAFVFNEAVCYEKTNDYDKAIDAFSRFLAANPSSAEAERTKTRITKLAAAREAAKNGTTPPPDTNPPASDGQPDAIKSLLLLESDPDGAPVVVWQKTDPSAAAFSLDGTNAGWTEAFRGSSPNAVTLPPGKFHITFEKWRTYNRSDTDLDVVAGRIHQFKANLSQGEFFAVLRVTSSNPAQVFLDDPPPHQKPAWGTTPHGEPVPRGKHKIYVEAPGFEPFETDVVLEAGEQKELTARMARVDYGFLAVDADFIDTQGYGTQGDDVEVFVDGQSKGKIPANEPLKLREPAGKHSIRAESSGFKTYEADVVVPNGQTVDAHVRFQRKWPRGAAISGAVGAAAFLAGGIVMGVESNKRYDALKKDSNAHTLLSGTEDKRASTGKALAYGSAASFVIAGGLTLFSVYEFIRDPIPPTKTTVDSPREFDAPAEKHLPPPMKLQVSLVPVLGPKDGGFVLKGSF